MIGTPLYGGIEAGGTKFRCAVAGDLGSIVSEICIETCSPVEILGETCHSFRPYVQSGEVRSIGMGAFGQLDQEGRSAIPGFINSAPKPGWPHTDIRGFVQAELGVEVAIDTGVNAGKGEA